MSNIKKAIGQSAFQDPEQEAVVSLLFCGQTVRTRLEALCKTEGISLSQFNILRILKGRHPEAYPRSEIRKRMIDKTDVTRSIDKLETMGLVKRISATEDKRHSLTSITGKGLDILRRLDGGFAGAHAQILAGLTKNEIMNLIMLLKKVR